MILITKKSFEEWGGVVGDEVMAAAMLDRLLHRCHVVNIQGTSYRMREYKAARAHTRRNAEKAAVATLPPPSPAEDKVDKSGTFKLDNDSIGDLGGRAHRGDVLGVPLAACPSQTHEIHQHAGTVQRGDPPPDPGGAHLPERGVVSTADSRVGGRDPRSVGDG